MAHPWHHALSSVKRLGGTPEAHLPVHEFFDSSKATLADWRHRAILHNSFGIFLAERLFGPTIDNGAGKPVPTRLIAEQHVREDLGWIPSVQDWIGHLPLKDWMRKGVAEPDADGVPIEPKATVVFTRAELDRALTGDLTGVLERLFSAYGQLEA